MQEKPLERLNYYNGMAVDAAGFKTEQEYHIRVRRWLNKSLYSAGIASGLEVREAGLGPNVVVSPGLALDSAGREIILLEETTVEVCSYYGGNAAEVVGNYLVIEYGEDAVSWEAGSCAVRSPVSRGAKSTNNGGGPSRVQAIPKFSWVPFVPLPGANQIVLARVELTQDCKGVDQIDPATRRYVGAASAATVRQYALEGEREVAFIPKESFPAQPSTAPQPTDVEVVGRIYFHIRGRQPNSVSLYLKAEELSKLHYTEMGNHQHSLTVGASVPTSSPIYDLAHPEKYTHSHTLNSLAVNANIGNESSHKHTALNVTFRGSHSDESDKVLGVSPRLPLEVPVYDNILPCLSMPTGRITGYGGTFGTDAQFGAAFTAVVEGATAHTHTLTGTTDDKELMDDHTHTFSPTVSMATAGVVDAAANPNYLARRGSPVSFVNDLRIAVDGFDKTIEIRDQIVDSVPGAQKPAWQSGLGNGASNHPLANEAFDAISIRLDFLPHVTFAEGQHVIELSVPRILDANGNPVPNGGRIHYNLYVE